MADLTDLGPHGVPMPFRIILGPPTGAGGIAKIAGGVVRLQDLNHRVVALFDTNTGVSVLISPEVAKLIQHSVEAGVIMSVVETHRGVVQLSTAQGLVITL